MGYSFTVIFQPYSIKIGKYNWHKSILDNMSYTRVISLNRIQCERKSEQAHIHHAPTLLENVVYNEWQFQALVTGNRTENHFHLNCTK